MISEYALLKGGEIINTVTTSRSLEETQVNYPQFTVMLYEDVSSEVRERYQFDEERP